MRDEYTEITRVHAREILDSRGNPTLEVDIETAGGGHGRAAVPSGASTGDFEALELRDDDNKRYLGKGVRRAVDNVNKALAEVVVGMDASAQRAVDNAMIQADGTPMIDSLGVNT